MNQKKCLRCGKSKSLEDFYDRAKGQEAKYTRCKPCYNQWVMEKRALNPEKEYQRRQRRQLLEREARRQRARDRRKHIREDRTSYRKKNPEKTSAKDAVAKAIKAGILIRPNACEQCGSKGLVHGHHADYSRKLDVKWLCAACHGQEHAALKRSAALFEGASVTPKQVLEARERHYGIIAKAKDAIRRAEESLKIPPIGKLRRAKPSDIIEGAIIFYRPGQPDEFWQIVAEVKHPDDDFKAYTAEDGCRYGLHQAFVEEPA